MAARVRAAASRRRVVSERLLTGLVIGVMIQTLTRSYFGSIWEGPDDVRVHLRRADHHRDLRLHQGGPGPRTAARPHRAPHVADQERAALHRRLAVEGRLRGLRREPAAPCCPPDPGGLARLRLS